MKKIQSIQEQCLNAKTEQEIQAIINANYYVFLFHESLIQLAEDSMKRIRRVENEKLKSYNLN